MWDSFIAENFNTGVVRPIAEVALGSPAASIDFTAIAADWMHLLLVAHARGDTAALSISMSLRFNADASGLYDRVDMIGVGSGNATSTEAVSQTSALMTLLPAATASAGLAGAVLALIPHYAGTTHHKTCVCLGGRFTSSSAGAGNIRAHFLGWRSASAIDRVTLLPSVGNFDTGSMATLYGMGGI